MSKTKINKRIFEHAKVQLPFRRVGQLSDLCSRQLRVGTRCPGPGREGRIEDVCLEEVVYTFLTLQSWDQQYWHHLGVRQKFRVSGLTPDLLNQNIICIHIRVGCGLTSVSGLLCDCKHMISGFLASSLSDTGLLSSCQLPFAKGWSNSPCALPHSLCLVLIASIVSIVLIANIFLASWPQHVLFLSAQNTLQLANTNSSIKSWLKHYFLGDAVLVTHSNVAPLPFSLVAANSSFPLYESLQFVPINQLSSLLDGLGQDHV